MKPPKHSKEAIKAHPAPVREEFKTGKEYAEACKLVHEARIEFDKPELRPSERLAAIGIDAICEYVSSGDSLRSWALKNGFSQRTVLDWIEKDEVRSAHYARARDERAELVFESLDDIGDQAVTAESAVEVAGLRLKADNIKWKLARMNPKKYGDKLAVGGADDLPPVQITEIQRKIIDPK